METIKKNNKNVENSNNFNSNLEKITAEYKRDENKDFGYFDLVLEYNTFLEEVQKDYLWKEVSKEIR